MADYKANFSGNNSDFQAKMGEVNTVQNGTAKRIGEVFLPSSAWQDCPEGLQQVVTVVPIAGAGVTAKSQVDLTPSAAQVAVFCEKYLTFVAENDGGVVTVFAIGQKPMHDYTMQVTLSEVIAEGKIIGITVGTPTSITRIREELDIDRRLLSDKEVEQLMTALNKEELTE